MSASRSHLKPVTKAKPCPVCEGDHKCSVGDDGLIICGRCSGDAVSFVCLGPAKGDEQFTLYRRESDPALNQNQGTHQRPTPVRPKPYTNGTHNGTHGCTHGDTHQEAPVDWSGRALQLAANLDEERRAELADALGIPAAVLSTMTIGFSPDGFHDGYYNRP